MGRIIITKKSPERNEARSGQGQGDKKSPGMLASIRTVLQVFRKELRKGSSRFRNLGSDWQLTADKLNYLGVGSVHGRGGRYRLAVKRK